MKTASMTQQQKREKAAELLGWKRLEHPVTGNDIWTFPGKFARDSNRLPLYDEDLNLMAEAEKHLPVGSRCDYVRILCSMMDGWASYPEFVTTFATAAQRLDAWLEVMMEGEE